MEDFPSICTEFFHETSQGQTAAALLDLNGLPDIASDVRLDGQPFVQCLS